MYNYINYTSLGYTFLENVSNFVIILLGSIIKISLGDHELKNQILINIKKAKIPRYQGTYLIEFKNVVYIWNKQFYK